jgi:hypothetical protein
MSAEDLATELRAIVDRLNVLEGEARRYRTGEKGDDVDTYIWSAASRLRFSVRLLSSHGE